MEFACALQSACFCWRALRRRRRRKKAQCSKNNIVLCIESDSRENARFGITIITISYLQPTNTWQFDGRSTSRTTITTMEKQPSFATNAFPWNAPLVYVHYKKYGEFSFYICIRCRQNYCANFSLRRFSGVDSRPTNIFHNSTTDETLKLIETTQFINWM